MPIIEQHVLRYQFNKAAVLSCHICLISTVVEKMNNIEMYEQMSVRVNVDIQTICYIFLKVLLIWLTIDVDYWKMH
jgi:hypothetical protein